MSYSKRLDHAFENAPVLPIRPDTRYVFFSDCHRGSGTNNDNFLKNENSYLAALQYYYQNVFSYIEVGDGDELWENRNLRQIVEIHDDVFSRLSHFQKEGRLYMLYGNHDMVKKFFYPLFYGETIYEGIIFHADSPLVKLCVTHGHQADFFNSVLWKPARFLVRYLWTPLEHLGFLDPTSAAKNNTKREKVENRLIAYAKDNQCLLLAGHTHRPTLGSANSPYFNCGSCVHPKGVTCIELDGYQIRLVKWSPSVEWNNSFDNIYHQGPPSYPLYISRNVLAEKILV